MVLGGATPSIVIALALIVTFSGNYGLNLYSTMWILIVSYLVKYMTMSVRTIAASFLIFMPSFYELTMSNLLYGSDTKSLGVLLYELQTYADTQNASVLSVIILLIVLIGNIILNKVTKGKVSI